MPTQWIPNPAPDGFGRDFRVGEDGIDLLYFGTTDRTVGLEGPPSDTDVERRYEDADVIRDVTINPGCADDITIFLRDDDNASRFNGDLIVGAEGPGQDGAPGTNVGALDIKGNILEVNASHNAGLGFNNGVVEVHNGADLTDSTDDLLTAGNARLIERAEAASAALAAFRQVRSEETRTDMETSLAALRAAQQAFGKTATHAGLLRFIGGDRTDVWVETSESRLRFDFPAMEVDKVDVEAGDDSRVTFDAEGVLSDAMGGAPANNADVIGTSHFTLIDAETGLDDCPDDGCGDGGGVELLANLDILDVGGSYHQFDGEFLMNGLSSIGPVPVKPYVQTVMVGFRFAPGDMVIENGEFYAGDNDPDAPGDFSGTGGNVEVFGHFCLGCTPPATSAAASKRADPSDGLFSMKMNGTHTVVGNFTVGPDTDPNETPEIEKRNRYFLGGECGVLPDKGGLFLFNDYHFEGTGDRFDDSVWLQQAQGLHGNVFFTGAVEQFVWHRQDEDAFFCDVVIASPGSGDDGIELLNNAWQNDQSTLTLERGIIDTDGGSWDWIIQNTGFETDLVGRNNASLGQGVVELGSRFSYADGSVERSVLLGNAPDGGYLFPVGTEENGSDFFRALILQFPDPLGLSSLARVEYRQDLTSTDVDFTPFDVLGAGGPLRLDGVANLFWQLDVDPLPIFDPTLRLELEELASIFDILKLRILQWDCDGTHPRLAGFFDLSGGDPSSAAVTAFINGVPNVTQVGVNLQACQLFGIATNLATNPISDVRRYVAMAGNDAGDCTNSLDPCATLAYAVGQANNGDIIDLAAGTYNEPGLLIEKNLIIQGQGVVVQ
ncbi:MAG: hypothetical protein IH820_05225 [Bacteroidetes bacterium]|nr:hypothetical protein [Bacteroidota bacterium]